MEERFEKKKKKRKEKRKKEKPASRTKQDSSTAQHQERKANRLESRKISADPRLHPTIELEDTEELGDLVTVRNEAVRPILFYDCVLFLRVMICASGRVQTGSSPHGAGCAAIV